jgi:hypothetical protein
MVPAAYVRLESMPLTPNGKLDRRALESVKELAPRREERKYEGPRTAVEEMLCGIWEEVLKVERVGIRDNFFDLGGDSILSIRIKARTQARGMDFPLQALFERHNIASLAEVVTVDADQRETLVKSGPLALLGEDVRKGIPPDAEDAYPLSHMQAGMLFHSEYAPEGAVYHIVLSQNVRLPYEADALQKAVDQVVQRHEVLRTSIEMGRFSEPLQIVHRKAKVRVISEDLRCWGAEEQKRRLREWLKEERGRAFQWDQAPLLRIYAHYVGEEEFVLSLSFHHAILDGWSEASLVTELLLRYEAFRKGESPKVEKLKVCYRDYIALEQEALQNEETRNFWERLLAGHNASPVPFAGTESGVRGSTALHRVPLDQQEWGRLRKLASRLGVPLKTVLLAGYLKMLSLLNGGRDVVTGVVLNGRPEVEDGEQLLGLFLNTLPLRIRIEEGRWEDLIRATWAVERAILPHRRYPMVVLKHKCAGGGELFATAFNFVHFHIYDQLEEMGSKSVMGRQSGFVTQNVPLMMHCAIDAVSGQMSAILEYDSGQVSKEDSGRIASYYATILSKMAESPESRMGDLLLEEEREQIREWNGTRRDYGRETSVVELFEEQVERTPDRIAVEYEGRQLSYRELNRRANQLGDDLRELDVRAEKLVGVCLERSEEMVVAVLGILKAGGGYVPLDANYPPERLVFMARDAQLKVIVTNQRNENLMAKTLG